MCAPSLGCCQFGLGYVFQIIRSSHNNVIVYPNNQTIICVFCIVFFLFVTLNIRLFICCLWRGEYGDKNPHLPFLYGP